MSPQDNPMNDFDIAIIGGGPAGASAAIDLARRGRRVVLLERDRFPRFHIGESLLATVNDSLARLGLTDETRAKGFQKKYGATFSTGDGLIERYADFSSAPDIAQPQTYQVPRAEFDAMLLGRAKTVGADVREQHRVLDVAFDAAGVTLRVADEREERRTESTLRVAAVVDASGRAGVLQRKYDLRVDEPGLANIAVYSHFANVPRQEGRRSGDIRIIARPDLGWFWMIPISDALMSVGVVLPRAAFEALSERAPRDPAAPASAWHEAILDRAIAETPQVAGLLAAATREWPVRIEKDYSYGVKRYAGDRFVLAGDAGSFLDPVFSTGVAIALEAGLDAAAAMDEALAQNDLSAARFERFGRTQRGRYLAFRRFVMAFYTHPFRDLFFQPSPTPIFFNAVVTFLAGQWRPSLSTRFLVWVFLLMVKIQGRFALVPRIEGVREMEIA